LDITLARKAIAHIRQTRSLQLSEYYSIKAVGIGGTNKQGDMKNHIPLFMPIKIQLNKCYP